ncbi:DUF6868 family protein [Vibrio diazotrophicus]|uniref:DUF6868 family protein n=1 Tax=Vibrio diazotrophicus TaxID=685 RepID=UPI00142E45EA|nr:hypothetical protein [Vibrio diazotrophicus]NIY94530.1 hypothetical protein [Vibrio diazotrophicus]
MDLTQITEFIGWCAVINVSVLIITSILLMLLKERVASYHSKLFNIPADSLNTLYFSYLSHFKIVTLTFFIAPYLALKIIV